MLAKFASSNVRSHAYNNENQECDCDWAYMVQPAALRCNSALRNATDAACKVTDSPLGLTQVLHELALSVEILLVWLQGSKT